MNSPKTIIRVCHEALLTHWKRAQEQIEQNKERLIARSRLESMAARWQQTEEQDKAGLLLPTGLQLE